MARPTHCHSGNVSLAFSLTMALMAMKRWELAAVAGPLLAILLVQAAIMFAFAYFVTYRIMGSLFIDFFNAVIITSFMGFFK